MTLIKSAVSTTPRQTQYTQDSNHGGAKGGGTAEGGAGMEGGGGAERAHFSPTHLSGVDWTNEPFRP